MLTDTRHIPSRRLARLALLPLLVALIAEAPLAGAKEEPEAFFQLEAFVVYAGQIDVIDGFTGEPYHETNETVSGFREDFNNLLLGFHKRLLVAEYENMQEESKVMVPFIKDLSEMAESFGIRGFSSNKDRLAIERGILQRLLKDPFFKIEALVVWDLAELEKRKNSLPDNVYARDIRYNEELGKWERRVTTEWRVSHYFNEENFFETTKYQGLNLDTNEGYHFLDRGLWAVPGYAFKEVKLTYPIIVDPSWNTDEQVLYLKQRLVQNLSFIYDPFSWAMRRNERFRRGYKLELQEHIADRRLPFTDREWFDPVIANFLNDLITIKYYGVDEVYRAQMVRAFPKNKHLLGNDLDLLNWNADENRTVDPWILTTGTIPKVDINNRGTANFILLYAYRRYGDQFLDALRTRMLAHIKSRDKIEAKELVLQAIEEASGHPRGPYLKAAAKAQEAELAKFKLD